MLDKITNDELYLTWMSCTDFNALNNEDNREHFNCVWGAIKKQLTPFFQNQDITLDIIANDLREFVININPTLSFGYDAERNVLLFNLWSLLFDVTVTNTVMPCMPWKLAAEIVHEHDHYLFLESMGMIGKNAKEQDEFSENNWVKIETRAYVTESKFLQKCKDEISSTLIHEFRITGWSLDGRPFPDSFYKCQTVSKQKIIAEIDHAIAECSNQIEKIKKKYNYQEAAKNNDISHSSDRAKILSLPINLKDLKAPFAEIKLKI
jgi:hypothetical protein